MGDISYGKRFSNVQELTEDDFNINPSNIDIWTGEFPFKPGDKFPRDIDRERANRYKTNKALYENKMNGIMDKVFSWADYMMNPITNLPNLAIVADLPDYQLNTEAWVELIAGDNIIIEAGNTKGDKEYKDKMYKVSDIVTNSNTLLTVQDIVRCGYIMYGNKVVKVSKLSNGNAHFEDMPLKCWIPFVNEDATSIIEVNLFFSIIKTELGQEIEFICYHEDGKIVKRTFEYNGNTIGEQIGEVEETEAFGGKGVSPIEVFTGDHTGDSIIGVDQYRFWDASIAYMIRCLEAIGVLIEQLKEIVRILPEGATRTNEVTGITYVANTGALVYKDGTLVPKEMVSYVKATIDLKSAIDAYKETLNLVSRATGLPLSYFDTKELGSQVSAKALEASMIRSRIKARKIFGNFENSLKSAICKLALANGIELSTDEFSIKNVDNFRFDYESMSKVIQSRCGNKETMNQAQAIREYDGISLQLAQEKADEINGVVSEEDEVTGMELSETGNESIVSNGLEFTAVENLEKGESRSGIIESPIGQFLP